jgi:hypothetical protein
MIFYLFFKNNLLIFLVITMSTLFPYTFTDKVHALEAEQYDIPHLELPPSYDRVNLVELVKNLRSQSLSYNKPCTIKDIITQK